MINYRHKYRDENRDTAACSCGWLARSGLHRGLEASVRRWNALGDHPNQLRARHTTPCLLEVLNWSLSTTEVPNVDPGHGWIFEKENSYAFITIFCDMGRA